MNSSTLPPPPISSLTLTWPFFQSFFIEIVSSLLAIILDSNPSQTILRQNPDNLTKVVDAVIVLANVHLLQRSDNQLMVLACHHHAT